MIDYKTIIQINDWIATNPDIFVARDESTAWESARKASGIKVDPKTFTTQCRRAGIDVRKHGDGCLIDFSHGALLVSLGVEQ